VTGQGAAASVARADDPAGIAARKAAMRLCGDLWWSRRLEDAGLSREASEAVAAGNLEAVEADRVRPMT